MYKILEMIEGMSIETLEKEKEKAQNIRYKLIHEYRLIEETMRKIHSVEMLLDNAIWEKKEGLCEPKKKGDSTAFKRIKDVDNMTIDDLKQQLVNKGLI
jgi:hypothetical protein